MPAAREEFEGIMAISVEITDIYDQENPYTSLTKEVKYLQVYNPQPPINFLTILLDKTSQSCCLCWSLGNLGHPYKG